MRDLVNAERVQAFLTALGEQLKIPTVVYLTGGASAVLEGWRESTVDLDLKFVPDSEVFGVLPGLKEKLRVNVELASPDHFLPPLPSWQDRSPFIMRVGCVEFRHFDFYSQALAKIERGFSRDLGDVREMVRRKLIDATELRRFSQEILPDLIRYPAVDPDTFLRAIETFLVGVEDQER